MQPKRKPLIDADGNVRELTKEDFAQMKRFDELPSKLQNQLRRAFRGPQKAPTKQQVTLRLSPEVLEHYRAGGRGWQTRIDQALVELVARQARRGSKKPATAKTRHRPSSPSRTRKAA